MRCRKELPLRLSTDADPTVRDKGHSLNYRLLFNTYQHQHTSMRTYTSYLGIIKSNKNRSVLCFVILMAFTQ